MSLDGEVSELEQRALEMGRHYCPGFGNRVQAIFVKSCILVEEPNNTGLITEAYQLLQQIEDFYKRIPFETLGDKEEFHPLHVVRRLLPWLREDLDSVMKKKDSASLGRFQTTCGAVVVVGRLYTESLTHMLKDIRAHPEAKDFKVVIRDTSKDVTWYF